MQIFEEAAKMRHALFVFEGCSGFPIGSFHLLKGGYEETAKAKPFEDLSDLRSIRLNLGVSF